MQSKKSPKPKPSTTRAAKSSATWWIILVAVTVGLASLTLGRINGMPKWFGNQPNRTAATGTPPPAGSNRFATEVTEPPWQAARHAPTAPLPRGAVAASEIAPPPPDLNAPPPAPPVPPTDPATHRPNE